ncbi:secretion protein HlyD [Phyllobacterium sp. 21LDTY02-6]|uniref:secretion protein HlyD n=1 Tax=Phyllobacterium sp. 21LDTY02-6 TaxID=2944903 RepID=UPI002020D07B|nr:secretion protein HlyD [Phyllobacterium sp. 21LDTY02-6]MCO4315580.1 secretion protein HlyD [Phyllobacterium sp. 21LDTY02-6]
MNRRALIIGLAGIALLAGAGWWFDVPARMGWAEPSAAERTLYGNVDIRQVQLGFRVNGRIDRLFVDEGDDVKAGAVIAQLDDEPYRNSVAAAEADVAALRSTLEKLVAGPRKTEIAQAEATLNERLADLKNVSLAHERAARLRPNGTISQAGLDEAAAAKAAAAARADSAREALALLNEGSRSEDIAAARSNLAAAEARLASARTSLADTQLRAPNDGVILSRVREDGAIVSPSDIVAVLSLHEPLWVRSYVSETELGSIRPGMEVSVFTDSDPGMAVKGKIGFISPVAEFTPKSVETPDLRTDLVYRLRIVIDGRAAGLRQGMPVTVRLPPPAVASR